LGLTVIDDLPEMIGGGEKGDIWRTRKNNLDIRNVSFTCFPSPCSSHCGFVESCKEICDLETMGRRKGLGGASTKRTRLEKGGFLTTPKPAASLSLLHRAPLGLQSLAPSLNLVGLGFWPFFSSALNKPAQNEEEKHRAGNPTAGATERESGHKDG